jgi:glutamine amidotransferase PdxT
MGYHYIDPNEIDTSIDPLEPEAWVFVPGPNGQRVLGAVEYLVSAPDWNATHSEVPNLFGHDFHAEGADLYALHAWIFKHNSLGMFADWNPKVSCP